MARVRDYGIPGTTVFDGAMAQKGYALNRMCYSFNSADNREAFRRDEQAYCRAYGLTDEQRNLVLLAVLDRVIVHPAGLERPTPQDRLEPVWAV